MFKALPGDSLAIDGVVFRFAEPPAAPGYVFGQEGKAGIVYRLDEPGSRCSHALKVFKPSYRAPELAEIGQKLSQFARLPGLSVSKRTVLTSATHPNLLQQNPELEFAVLMPWINGPSWWEIICSRRLLERALSRKLARQLCQVFAGLEQEGVAHCDLSGANIVLPELELPNSGIELVDIEQMYSCNFGRPSKLTAGSPGYSRHCDDWSAPSDRLSGAILLAEILGWSDSRILRSSSAESYFEAEEIGKSSSRFDTMSGVLREHYGDETALLFDLAWKADSPAECPKLRHWHSVLSKAPDTPTAPVNVSTSGLNGDLERASQLEEEGRAQEALSLYRQIQSASPKNSALYSELAFIITELEAATQGASAEKAGSWLKRARARLGHARAFVFLGESEKAMSILTNGLEELPTGHSLDLEFRKLLAELGSQKPQEMKKQGSAATSTSEKSPDSTAAFIAMWQVSLAFGTILFYSLGNYYAVNTLAAFGTAWGLAWGYHYRNLPSPAIRGSLAAGFAVCLLWLLILEAIKYGIV